MLPWLSVLALAGAVLLLGLEVKKLSRHVRKMGIQMANLADKIALLDAATTAVGTELAKHRASLVDVATEEQLAHLDALVASLNAMAQDPNNPVPVPVPAA